MNSIVELIYRNNSNREEYNDSGRKREVMSFRKIMKNKNGRKELAVIAEFKRASPSGFFNASNSDLMKYLEKVTSYGISGISILAEPDYFKGSLSDVSEAQEFNLPILVKDFISSRRMIDDAYKAGGDIILLIADFLNREDIKEMLRYTHDRGMEALLEFHDLDEIRKINGAEDAIIGYNRRNLRTMSIEPQEEKVLEMLEGSSVPLILESGINSSNLDAIDASRFNGLLIGSSILGNDGILEKLQRKGLI